MNDMQSTTPFSVSDEENSMGLIDLLIALAKHKRLVIGLPILTSICAALFSLMLPNIYKADTKILPPQQSQSTASALLSQC